MKRLQKQSAWLSLLLLLLLLLLLVSGVSHAAALTYEEFKQLTPEQREALINSETGIPLARLHRWTLRLTWNELGWQNVMRSQLVDHNELSVITALFIQYKHFGEQFGSAQATDLVGRHLPAAQLRAGLDRAREREKTYEQTLSEVEALLPTVVPSKDTRWLSQQANELSRTWSKLEREGIYDDITPRKMLVIDGEAQAILARLKALPKLTPEQVQRAIDDLPESP